MNNKTVKFAVAAALIGSAVLFTGVEAKAAEVRITLPGISLCFGSDDDDHCPPPPPQPVVVVESKPAIDVKLDFKDRKDHKRFDRPNPKPHGNPKADHRPKSKAPDHKAQPGHRR